MARSPYFNYTWRLRCASWAFFLTLSVQLHVPSTTPTTGGCIFWAFWLNMVHPVFIWRAFLTMSLPRKTLFDTLCSYGVIENTIVKKMYNQIRTTVNNLYRDTYPSIQKEHLLYQHHLWQSKVFTIRIQHIWISAMTNDISSIPVRERPTVASLSRRLH